MKKSDRMKKLTLFIVTLLMSTVSYAQVTWDEAGIKKAAAGFATLMGEGQIGQAMLQYSHPKLFEKVLEMSGQDMPMEDFKKIIVAQAEATMNDSTMKMSIADFKINKISELITKDDVIYSLVATASTLTMQFKMISDEMEEDLGTFKMTGEMLKAQYGADNVTIDEKAKKIVINATTNTLAIGDKTLDDWKIMDYKKEQLIYFEILPKEVADQLDKFEKE